MKEKWKLCVISGGILLFSVLGTMILLNRTMSSADGKVKEFTILQESSGKSGAVQAVSGSLVSGEAAGGEPVLEEKPGENTDLSGGTRPVETEKPYSDKNEAERKGESESDKRTYAFSGAGDEGSDAYLVGKEIPADPLGVQIADYAARFQGVRYVYGGTRLPEHLFSAWSDSDIREKEFDGTDLWGDDYGVDCSGLVMKVYESFDIELPRSVKGQAEKGKEVKLKDIEPGDIIFYGANNAAVTHCGIYMGSGQVLHVSAQTKVVKFDDMNYRRIAKVKRVVEE